MRVTVTTPDRFEAKVQSWLSGMILLVLGVLCAALGLAALGAGEAQGAIFSAIGLGLLALGAWLLSLRTHVVFDRPANRATLRFASLFGAREAAFPLDSVQRARVLRQRLSGRRQYNLVLVVTRDGTAEAHSLSRGYGSGGWRKGRLSRAINAWLGVAEGD
ncbi:hypothetical protein [Maliponia aquimaris]|uniref:Uncharacterized protein n=1 Tax=Maliponia aquimaris TaxID=1673631 RepID=A0A238K8I0_9RHOB|nr:hypothetical protein [Maliponia aquimaris]SMX39221.1 hypothetical protein MAA8898_01941 [Maliponia aquimaris]